MLLHLGFSVHFVNWVMICVSSVSFVIIINGSVLGFFRSRRRLRQGCPLSPLLFLIVAEGLSRTLKGIKLGRSLYLIHLLFVDDIILFCDGSGRNVLKLKEILDLYCTASRMKVNLNKSSISFFEVNEDEVRYFIQLFPFQ
jgi:hypothetical protein